MKRLQTVRRLGSWAARLIASFSLLFCFDGAVQLCFCAADPDGCGDHCHECSTETSDECAHVTVQVDAPALPQCEIALPQIVVAGEDPGRRAFLVGEVRRALSAYGAGRPPDYGGGRISNMTRLCPRS